MAWFLVIFFPFSEISWTYVSEWRFIDQKFGHYRPLCWSGNWELTLYVPDIGQDLYIWEVVWLLQPVSHIVYEKKEISRMLLNPFRIFSWAVESLLGENLEFRTKPWRNLISNKPSFNRIATAWFCSKLSFVKALFEIPVFPLVILAKFSVMVVGV